MAVGETNHHVVDVAGRFDANFDYTLPWRQTPEVKQVG
jgi:hypothetical protein